MYCQNCGNKITGNEKYCPNCGHYLNNDVENTNNNTNKSTEESRSTSITLGILSLVGIFLFVFSPISVILSIIGLVLAIKSNKNVKNTIGIVLNAVALFISAIITGIIILIICFSVNIIKYGTSEYGNLIDNYIHQNSVVNDDNKF